MNKLEQFCHDKKLAEKTCGVYASAVNLYEEVIGKKLDELILEAEEQEEQGIRWKKREIKNHLVLFRNYLYANKSEGTAKRYLNSIRTIYRHYEIELHKLPSYNSKQIDKTYVMDYEDLLTTEELIDAYYEANNLFKCWIEVGISTGLSKQDMLNLQVNTLVDACIDYLTQKGMYIDKSMSLIEKLLYLRNKELIPCLKGERQKTGSKYITFVSPEATEHTIQYLIGRDAKIRKKYQEKLEAEEDVSDLHEMLLDTDTIFDVTPEHVSYVFKTINDKLKLGKVGKYAKFTSHKLRKFHASTLLNSEIVTWTVAEIDTLQGRSMDSTHQAYFKNSKDKLFKKYYECVDELMLFKRIHGVDEEELNEVKKENEFYKKEIVKNENLLSEQQQRIDEIIKNQRELEALLGL